MKCFVHGQFYGNEDKKALFVSEEGKILGYDLAQRADEVIDLNGGILYPGFHDAHLHLLAFSEKMFYQVDLSDADSKAAVIEKTRAFIQKNKPQKGSWVVGLGWHEAKFKDPTPLTAADLEVLGPDYPIVLYRACFHIGVVNNRALDILDLPLMIEGGQIDRVAGKPTGILRESALDLLKPYQKPLAEEEIKALLLNGLNALKKKGLTAVWTDDFSYVKDKKLLWAVYQELNEKEELPLRVFLQLRIESLADVAIYRELGLKSGWMHKNLGIASGKIIADGSLGGKTAFLRAPYENTHEKGLLIYPKEMLSAMIHEAFEAGLDMAVHAIGDGTLEAILEIYEENQALIQKNHAKPSIIHCQIGSRALYEKMSRLKVSANVQPIFIQSDYLVAQKYLGDRALESYQWKQMLDLGVLVYGSSDCPIEDACPISNLYAAIYRKDIKGLMPKPFLENQAMAIPLALQMFTENAARGLGHEAVLGKLEPGYEADFVLLTKALTEEADFQKTQVKGICVRGKWTSL